MKFESLQEHFCYDKLTHPFCSIFTFPHPKKKQPSHNKLVVCYRIKEKNQVNILIISQ